MTPPLVVEQVAALRARLAAAHQEPLTIGFVPTMGALHDGHARLIEHSLRDCDHTVVSIFVNPLQFDRRDDLDRYPRTFEADTALCHRLGVDTIFAPPVAEMYPAAPECSVDVGRLADHLCGRHRPGHFRGVATVVLKLFEMVRPDRAYFGEKDAQQLAVIRRMVSDFNLPLVIEGVPTVRESDGLALSSRNRLIAAADRPKAIALYRALKEVERLVGAGERNTATLVDTASRLVPPDPAIRLEYLEVVDPIDLQPLAAVDGPALVAGAMWVGSTRLIDNIRCVTP